MIKIHAREIIVGVIITVLGGIILAVLRIGGPTGETGATKGSEPIGATLDNQRSPVAEMPPKAGFYSVNRLIYDDGANTITLVNFEVTTSGKLKASLRYQSHSTGSWSLSCPSPAPDLQSSHITLNNDQRVYPEDTYCTSQRPGQTFSVLPGGTLDTWGIFPVAPTAGTRFALNWYGFPVVEGLILKS